jgi:hypothetical protein
MLLSVAARFGGSALRQRAARMVFAAMGGWGKLTWWRRVGLYHVERPSV